VSGLGGWQEEIQLFCPGNEAVYRVLGFFNRLRPFEAVQDFVAIVHAGTRFMLAQQGDRVCQGADNPPVAHVKFPVKAQLGWILHGGVNRPRAVWFLSEGTGMKKLDALPADKGGRGLALSLADMADHSVHITGSERKTVHGLAMGAAAFEIFRPAFHERARVRFEPVFQFMPGGGANKRERNEGAHTNQRAGTIARSWVGSPTD
jgi:hypothetical protein